MTLVKSLYSGDPDVIDLHDRWCYSGKSHKPERRNNPQPSYLSPCVKHVHMHWGSPVEDRRPLAPRPNRGFEYPKKSCLDSSLGRVPACDAGDPGSI